MRAALASCCLVSVMVGAGNASARGDGEFEPATDPLYAGDLAGQPAFASEPVASVVQVVLNGNPLSTPMMIAASADEIFLPVDLLNTQRIRATQSVRIIGGRQFVPASLLNAESVRLDTARDTLRIDCTADCFNPTLVSARPADRPELSPVAPGGFLNYDLFMQGGDIEGRAGALLETGVFSPAGTGIARIACAHGDTDDHCLRLGTTWTVDTPASATRLEIGDTTTGAESWGIPARFGGVRWGTDFSLTPDFITFPTPSISGDATLPGVVDVIINDTQRYSTTVPAGPFTLTDLPVVTGAGSTQLVMTDVLGRQSVVTADYYAAPQLLKRGLKNWSLEAGFLRENYGLQSNRYDQGFVAGSYARGLNDALTFAARSEIGARQQSAGLSGAVLSPALGIFQAAAAVSQSNDKTGGLVDLRQEWRSPAFSLGSSVSYSTDQFRQFGQDHAPPRLTARTFASYSDADLGAISLSWTHRDERIQEDFSTLGLRYTRTLGPVSLNVSALRFVGVDDRTMATISISMPLGGSTSAGMSIDDRDGRLGGDVRIRKSVAPAGGLGYSGQAGIDGVERYEAGIEYRTRFGDTSGTINATDGRSAGRLSVRGGIALVGGTLVAAPSITDSIAVVKIGDEPGVHVFQDRQPVGVTDRNGRIVLTRLRPFERNILSFDPRDVSLDADFDTTEAVVVPGLRTGHKVAFDITESRSVLAYIVDTDGTPISSDGQIADADTGDAYPIGQGGRIYLTDAHPVTRLKFIHNKVICEARIELGPFRPSGPYEDVGDVKCIPTSALK